MRLIGLDPGFGGVKVAEVVGQETVDQQYIRTCMVPSVVGVGTTEAGGLGLAGVVRSGKRGQVPQMVGFEGVEYLVGANVHEYARPLERMDMARFTDGPELRALLYAALWGLLDGGGYEVGLAVGLPVEVLQDEDLARETERAINGWLVRDHVFTVNGEETRLRVARVRAKIAQPVATWLDWGLDLQGRWTRKVNGRSAAKAPVLVVDQGFNTLDLLAVEEGRISTRYTGGDRLGMRRAAEMTASNIRRRYGVELSLHEADGLVQSVVSGGRAETYVVGRLVDVTAEVRQAVNALSAEVVRFVERNVGTGRKFQILLTGGGALALVGTLRRQFEHAAVVPEPVMANARGLAKVAVRKGFLG